MIVEALRCCEIYLNFFEKFKIYILDFYFLIVKQSLKFFIIYKIVIFNLILKILSLNNYFKIYNQFKIFHKKNKQKLIFIALLNL